MPNNQYRLFGFRLSFHEIAVLLICGLDNKLSLMSLYLGYH